MPLSGIQAMLSALCGVAEGDAEPRIQRVVVPRLRALGLHDDEVSAVLTSLGVTGSRAGGNDVPAASAKALLANAFTRMVLRLCEDNPQAFAWDAAHSMDADSYWVLETVSSRVPQARALFVLATRAGFSHPLEKLAVHASIDLADLRPEDASREPPRW